MVWAIWRPKSYQKLDVNYLLQIMTNFLVVYGALNTGIINNNNYLYIAAADHSIAMKFKKYNIEKKYI